MLAAGILSLLAQHGRLGPAVRPDPPAAPPASVLIVVLDDVGMPDVEWLPTVFGPQGLAARGVTFSRAYSAPLCSPSRAMLLSGMYPRRFGVGGNLDPFDPKIPPLPELDTLPDLLAPLRPTALIGKWHLGRAASLAGLDPIISGPPTQGFSTWLAGNPATPSLGPGATGYYDWIRVDDDRMTESDQYATDAQVDAFLAWWGSSPAPRSAWLSLSASHDPWDPPPFFGYDPEPDIPDRERFQLTTEYAAARLREVLEAADLSSTFVVVVSDNGTPNNARPPASPFGRWKFTTFEGGINVPMVIAGPGIKPGVSDRLVSLVDLPATLAELLGVAPRAAWDSVSFANELGSWKGAPPRQFVFSERYSPVHDDQAVVEEGVKLRRVDPDGDGPMGAVDHFYVVQDGVDVSASLSQLVKDRLRAELASLPPRAP